MQSRTTRRQVLASLGATFLAALGGGFVSMPAVLGASPGPTPLPTSPHLLGRPGAAPPRGSRPTTRLPLSSAAPPPSATKAVGYLATVLDQYHHTFDVYTDSDAAGNHFVALASLSSTGTTQLAPVMDMASTDSPHSGITCIKATFSGTGLDWAGWYFMNGILQGSAVTPSANWGNTPAAGIDLSGATKLTFWARGAVGGEVVEFFAFGVGWGTLALYSDSSPKVSLGSQTLSTQWQLYTISLTGVNLSYVLGGFGWVATAAPNANQGITFYLDDIQYDKARLADPRFLVSFATIPSSSPFDMVLRNAAFAYDNAVALLAFLVTGDLPRAGLIADAFVYATQNDRYYTPTYSPVWLRNAYQGGDLILPPGWTPNGKVGTVRMPGWSSPATGIWTEDKVQVSTYAGNVAWVMLALLAYYATAGGSQYLATAKALGAWVQTNCADTRGAGGYTGGYEGWEPSPLKRTYKATEHNIDLTAAFGLLNTFTGDSTWAGRSAWAKGFVSSMWDSIEGKFWTGTGDDGVTVNTGVIPVDIQAWALLALQQNSVPYWRALDYADAHQMVGGGFDFDQDLDGVWYEGTAQMAVADLLAKRAADSQGVVNFLQAAQDSSGGMFAANIDGLSTGFSLPDGSPWLYYRRLHVGATGWLVFAVTGTNPFALDALISPHQVFLPVVMN